MTKTAIITMSSTIFQAEQLRSARRLRAISLRELAENLGELGIALSKQAINKYETGESQPSELVVQALSKALKVPVNYFYHSAEVNLDNIAFRKLEKYPAKESDKVIERVKLELSKYLELEAIMNIGSEFKQPEIPNRIGKLEDIDDYADELRDKWGLGTAPIANVLETLEDRHIKVVYVESSVELDGFSTKANGIYPVVVLNKTKLDDYQDRKRWTALHELGHLLLDFGDAPDKQVERFCHYFAGSMLFPKENFYMEVGRNRNKLSFEELKALKQEYGISMQAIIYRAKELEIITESYYRQFFFMFNQLGYKINEPIKYIGKKASSRFDQLLFRALTEEVITIDKAAEFKGLTVKEFQKEYPFI